jgi:branched-subunit amino acid transport protein AzlD
MGESLHTLRSNSDPPKIQVMKKVYDPSDMGMLVLYATRNIKLSETPVLTAKTVMFSSADQLLHLSAPYGL